METWLTLTQSPALRFQGALPGFFLLSDKHLLGVHAIPFLALVELDYNQNNFGLYSQKGLC
jgi:hypothetical protein